MNKTAKILKILFFQIHDKDSSLGNKSAPEIIKNNGTSIKHIIVTNKDTKNVTLLVVS
jgi:hypothetical protein